MWANDGEGADTVHTGLLWVIEVSLRFVQAYGTRQLRSDEQRHIHVPKWDTSFDFRVTGNKLALLERRNMSWKSNHLPTDGPL